MPVKYLPDEDGYHLKVLDINGFYIPDFGYSSQERDFRLLGEWQARDDDVIICNYPKSGTHWVWEMINMLYRQKAEFVEGLKDDTMIECISKEKFDFLPSPRILNSHLYFSMLPKDFIKRKGKIVYTVRNPKDVAVSYFHHHRNILMYEYSGSWESYLKRFLIGDVDYKSWFQHTLDWYDKTESNEDYPIHLIYYEDLHTNYIEEIKKLASYLGIQANESLVKKIGEKCKFDVMKTEKCQDLEDWRDSSDGMYRKGKVGDWKSFFTTEQNMHFDEVYQKQMKGLNIKLKFSIEK